jgi:hypothetical protein
MDFSIFRKKRTISSPTLFLPNPHWSQCPTLHLSNVHRIGRSLPAAKSLSYHCLQEGGEAKISGAEFNHVAWKIAKENGLQYFLSFPL